MKTVEHPDGSVDYDISIDELDVASTTLLKMLAYMRKNDALKDLQDHLEIAYVCTCEVLNTRREKEADGT